MLLGLVSAGKAIWTLVSEKLLLVPRNTGNFGLSEYWKSESWFLESRIQLKESGIPLTTGILNPGSTGKKSRIHSLESGVHSVDSRIYDCLELPYRECGVLNCLTRPLFEIVTLPLFLSQVSKIYRKAFYLFIYLSIS